MAIANEIVTKLEAGETCGLAYLGQVSGLWTGQNEGGTLVFFCVGVDL